MPQFARVATFEFDEAFSRGVADHDPERHARGAWPAKRVTVLADRAGRQGRRPPCVFDSEEDLKTGSATLDAMNPPEVGRRRRISVDEYEVVLEQETP